MNSSDSSVFFMFLLEPCSFYMLSHVVSVVADTLLRALKYRIWKYAVISAMQFSAETFEPMLRHAAACYLLPPSIAGR